MLQLPGSVEWPLVAGDANVFAGDVFLLDIVARSPIHAREGHAHNLE